MKGHAGVTPQRAFSLSDLSQSASRRLRRWWELYQQRQELARMSDATLHDLGLSRADIQREAERPFWDDPLSKG